MCVGGGCGACVMYVNLMILSKKSEIYLELLHKSTAQI